MFIYSARHSVLFKAVAIVLVCLFFADTVVLADSDTLAPSVGNPKVYQEMRSMMKERITAHQDPIYEFIKQNAYKAKSLSAIPSLEEEFTQYINACEAKNMLTRLKTTITYAGGKIQVIFVKSEEDLPVFDGKRAWGHAGTYITVFALDSEKDSKKGRKKIIVRLFHEIRARSTRAKELFDGEFEDKNPATSETISAFIRSTQERFERENLQIQQEIEQYGRITNPISAREFAALTFAVRPHVMNRDYMTVKEPHEQGKYDSAQIADIKIINNAINDIKSQLARVDNKEAKRKDVNEGIKKILLQLRRENKPYFSLKQTDKISKIRKLNERSETLRLLFLYQDNGVFVFKGAHLALILASSRKEKEIKSLISTLKGLGISKGAHLALILASSRKEEEIKSLVSTLKELGITEGAHLALILASARKEEEIKSLIGTLKGLGITEGAHLALILHGSRKEEEIKTIVSTLKGLGISEGAHLALILASSRKEEEVKTIVSTLKGLGITEGTHLAPILASSRKEEEVKGLVSTLKELGITEGTHLALILASSRKEEEIKSLISTLKGLGISEGTHLALILASSRKEEEIKSLISKLKGLGISEGAHLALILHGSRKEEEIETIISTLKELGITEGAHLALILHGSRKEEEIKTIVSTLKGLGITEGTHLALILASARKEEEVKSLVSILKELGITEGYHLALILHGSRKEEEIKGLVSTLKRLGITEGYHLALILASSRKEEEIKALISTLKRLGITEGTHLALILHGSRKEEEILLYINAFMRLKKKISDFNIPNSLIVQMIANPEFITRNFSYMLTERAGLPPLDRLLRDEEKRYLQFRLLLRQFGLDTIYGLIDMFAEDSGKREKIKSCIRDRVKEENTRLSALSEVERFSEDDYKEAGLLLFSCDKEIRIAVRNILIERHFDRINRYKDAEKKSLAGELLLDVSTRYNIYYNLLIDDLRHPSYIAYLESYLKLIDLISYYRDQPESLQQIKKEFEEFKVQFKIEHNGQPSEQELITEFARERRHAVGVVLLALGKVRVRSLDEKIGEDTTLMDLIPAPPVMPDNLVDEQLLYPEEEQSYNMIPDEYEISDRKTSAKRKRPSPGSIESIFTYLCDNNITEASESITGWAIADKMGRSYATIDYDLRALLYHLKLIQKSEEDKQRTGKDARYYVPEAVKKKSAEVLSILEQFRGKDLRPRAALLDQIYEEKIQPILTKESPSLTFAIHPDVQRTDIENIDKAINDIKSQLARVDNKEAKRKDVNEGIKKILLQLRRENKPYFSLKQTDKISKIRKLNGRSETLRLLFLYQDNGVFVFKGAHLALILASSRKEKEIKSLISTLKGLGISKGAHLALILASSRKEEEIKSLVSTLKELGITEGHHLALILTSSRKEEEIKSLISALKGLGITESTHLALILASSRKEEEIKSLISTLKELGVSEGYHLALILHGSRKEKEIKALVGTLKELGITEGAHLALILASSRKEEEIKALVDTLKGLGVTEGTHLALILASSRKEKEIKALVNTLKELGISEGTHLALILSSSRKEEEIKALVNTLKELGISEGYHLALILHGSRKEEEIKALVNTLKELGISKGTHLALILRSSRKEEEIKSLVSTLKGLGITEGAHLALILTSSRKEKEIKVLINTLKGLGITEGTHLALILTSSRKEKEIKSLISALKELGITEGTHLALILTSSRKEKEIKVLINTLKELGITEGYHLALILHGSRKEEEVLSYINAFMRLKKKISDFDIPNFLIAQMIANPEFITRNFSYMLTERAGLLPLDRLLKDEEKRYLQFRLLLRQFGLDTIYGLVDIFAENSGKREEIKSCIRDRVKEENTRLLALLKAERFSEDDYKEAGLLLFSCDKEIRIAVRNILIERHFDRINRYKDAEKKSLAGELLLDVSTRYNIYHNLLIDDLRHPSYIAYLESCLKFIDLISYYRDQPESLQQIKKEFEEFKVQFEIEHNRKPSEQESIAKFARERRHAVGVVLLALGKVRVRSLDEKIGEYATLMDLIPAPPVMPDSLVEDEQLLHLEEERVYKEQIQPPSRQLSNTGAISIGEALQVLPQEWSESQLKSTELTTELSLLLQIENILDQDKSTFIFSEKVTFDNGLGILLPKLAKSGMRVTVIATNDRQRALIDELNQGKPENERIIYADTIADIRTKIHTARYYYFKVDGDPDTDLQGITTFDITEIVKKIIDALGRISGIVEREKLELLHEAARKFAQAA